jgi:putative component of toxin-antitoxin plasmid stabilization module
MENRPRNLEIYARKDGKIPYQDWFLGLDDKVVKAKILKRLDQLVLGGFGQLFI